MYKLSTDMYMHNSVINVEMLRKKRQHQSRHEISFFAFRGSYAGLQFSLCARRTHPCRQWYHLLLQPSPAITQHWAACWPGHNATVQEQSAGREPPSCQLLSAQVGKSRTINLAYSLMKTYRILQFCFSSARSNTT